MARARFPGCTERWASRRRGNSPGGRTEATGWTDANGNFWLFGGSGSDAHGIIGHLNDLWVYMPVTPAPTLDPAPGNYTTVQTVTIADSTPGAFIYYTTDGTNPTTSSSKYSGPITVSSTQTIMAIAAASGYSNSAVTSGTYTIQSPAATPAFSPASGTFATAQMVAISDATPGASIYYTTDGTNPTTSSSKYSGPITVSSTQTIEAIAAASGFSNSAVASGLYTIQPPAATPAFSPAGGTYSTTQMVTMSDATPGASIYYTTDGTNPTPSSSKYSGPITVSSTQTVNAIAAANGYRNSAVGSAAYVIQPPPTFAFSGSPGSLTIASGGEGTVTLTVTPQNGFYGDVSFACTGLPSGVGCTFSPTTVTPSGTSAVTTQLTFAATTATGSLRGNPVLFNPAASLALAVGFLWLGKRRRVWLALLLAVSAGAGMLMACGGGSSTQPPTPNAPVTSTVTVNATSGSIQQSTTVTLTVN